MGSLFISYGRPVETLSEVPLSYKETVFLISRRFFCMQGQHTLGFEDLPKFTATSHLQPVSEQFEIIMNATGNPSHNNVLDDILYHIDHNYYNNIKSESIAPLFGYNSAYLGKIFNKTVGKSFNSYVDHVRIEHSKEMPLSNNLKVYEVAERVGYRNVDYFYKKFWKYVGESPAEFRKQNGNVTDEESSLSVSAETCQLGVSAVYFHLTGFPVTSCQSLSRSVLLFLL